MVWKISSGLSDTQAQYDSGIDAHLVRKRVYPIRNSNKSNHRDPLLCVFGQSRIAPIGAEHSYTLRCAVALPEPAQDDEYMVSIFLHQYRPNSSFQDDGIFTRVRHEFSKDEDVILTRVFSLDLDNLISQGFRCTLYKTKVVQFCGD
ncbi:hypothetical protein NHQ30_001245 [Ciborinia camelliae]|nr:hypothetical protein NHQ30_001245 [Ciborinia camelliae]